MYGLLTQAYESYRIDKDRRKEGYKFVKNYMSWPAHGALTLLEVALTVLSILLLFDSAMVSGWDNWLLVLLLVLFFVPFLGDVLALAIIVYWIVTIRPRSILLRKLGI